ncbi:purine-nucleoside phosphorylase [Achromobacter xylosoxidans]|nr:purine-nucleoside phosphorylase [Achromobacter xylosoxidans]
MQHVLVSACLLGNPVRYDGRGVPHGAAVLARWLAEGRVVAVCPEVAGGLPIPRPPAEIEPGRDAASVLAGHARVVAVTGDDVTAPFVYGAREALAAAQAHGVRIAVLKEGSPSCGSGYVYDGHFAGRRQPGVGVTAELLRDAGLHVFSEHQWTEAQAFLATLEAGSAG